MSELADHELDRLRRERDEAQAEAARLRAVLEPYCPEDYECEAGHIPNEDSIRDCGFCQRWADARAALAPVPGPAGERQEAVVEVDEDSDVRKLLERHPLP